MKKLSLTLASREIMWFLRKILQPFVDTNLAQRNLQTMCPGWWIESCSGWARIKLLWLCWSDGHHLLGYHSNKDAEKGVCRHPAHQWTREVSKTRILSVPVYPLHFFAFLTKYIFSIW